MAILIFTPISDANVVPPFATTFLSFFIDIVVISYLVILDFIDYHNTYLSFWTKACFTQKGFRMTSPMEKNSTTTSYPAGIATKTFRTYSLLARQKKCLTDFHVNKLASATTYRTLFRSCSFSYLANELNKLRHSTKQKPFSDKTLCILSLLAPYGKTFQSLSIL